MMATRRDKKDKKDINNESMSQIVGNMLNASYVIDERPDKYK